MSGKYILEGKEPKLVEDVLEWGMWLETADRCVAETHLPKKVRVSTVFLGLDHSFDGGTPILFETMIFGGEFNQDMWRYSTWEEAEKGHQEAVKKVRGSDGSQKDAE